MLKKLLAFIFMSQLSIVYGANLKMLETIDMSSKDIVNVSSITFVSDGSLITSNTYFYFTSLEESQTTSSSYQDKLVSTVTLAGTYMISWSGEISNGTTNKAADVRFYSNTNGTLNTSSFVMGSNLAMRSTVSGFYIVTTTGTEVYKIQWRQLLGGTASIENARIFWKKLF